MDSPTSYFSDFVIIIVLLLISAQSDKQSVDVFEKEFKGKIFMGNCYKVS